MLVYGSNYFSFCSILLYIYHYLFIFQFLAFKLFAVFMVSKDGSVNTLLIFCLYVNSIGFR